MTEFIGTSQELDMGAVTDTSGGDKKEEEKKEAAPAEQEVDEEDPFRRERGSAKDSQQEGRCRGRRR